MSSNKLFLNALEIYNTWYKFINYDAYHEKSYKLFNKARKYYFAEKNYNKVYECYDWMIKCLIDTSDISKISVLGVIYEKFGDFIKKFMYDRDKIISNYDKADAIYTKTNNLAKIIKIKTKKIRFYKKFIKKYLSITYPYQKNSYDHTELCRKIFSEYDIENSLNPVNNVIIMENLLANVTNLKTQICITEFVYEIMKIYTNLTNEILYYEFEQNYINYLSNNKEIYNKISNVCAPASKSDKREEYEMEEIYYSD